MTTQAALEIKKAIFLLSETISLSPEQVVARLCFYETEKFAILKQASDIWNNFEDSDIVERGKMLGYDIVTN